MTNLQIGDTVEFIEEQPYAGITKGERLTIKEIIDHQFNPLLTFNEMNFGMFEHRVKKVEPEGFIAETVTSNQEIKPGDLVEFIDDESRSVITSDVNWKLLFCGKADQVVVDDIEIGDDSKPIFLFSKFKGEKVNGRIYGHRFKKVETHPDLKIGDTLEYIDAVTYGSLKKDDKVVVTGVHTSNNETLLSWDYRSSCQVNSKRFKKFGSTITSEPTIDPVVIPEITPSQEKVISDETPSEIPTWLIGISLGATTIVTGIIIRFFS